MKRNAPLSPVEKLTAEHDLTSFECGQPSLDGWLRRWALTNQKHGSAQTYVVYRDGAVVGYYSLAAGTIRPEDAPARVVKGLARHPIPVILLARLAVDQSEQGAGLGRALLKDALLRASAAADIIGARAVVVHALDDEARRFYQRWGFEPTLASEFHLFLLMKDVRAIWPPRVPG